MNIKRNIIFALEGRKKNGVAITENVPIRMRVNYDGDRVEFTMPYRIDVSKWDAAKQRVKNGCTNKLKVPASEINAEMTRHYTLLTPHKPRSTKVGAKLTPKITIFGGNFGGNFVTY